MHTNVAQKEKKGNFMLFRHLHYTAAGQFFAYCLTNHFECKNWPGVSGYINVYQMSNIYLEWFAKCLANASYII